MVDTGGLTEAKTRHPLEFTSLYRGLGVDYVLGVDYLTAHSIVVGTTAGAPRKIVNLDVRAARQWTLAFVPCTIGEHSYRMLLDTAALAWPSKLKSKPAAVIYVASSPFETLHRRHPKWPYRKGGLWIVDARGHFVEARSMVAETTCGGVARPGRVIVERADDSTYRYMRQLFGLKVDGDASLAAFEASGIRISFPKATLAIY